MALNLAKAVISYLKDRPEEKFTARQIAEWVFAAFPAECQAKKESSKFITNDAELVQQLVAEISSQRPVLQKRHPEIKTTEGRPRKYYYSEKSDSAEVAAVENGAAVPSGDASQPRLDEHALYPLLSRYLWEEFSLYSKRIDEKRSSNKRGPNGNRWLYPDLVGMEDLGADWHQEVRDCVNFIKLDLDNPADSQVLIPAREREGIDWDMANRLATENRDFLEYVKLVKQFYQTGEVRLADWDVPEVKD